MTIRKQITDCIKYIRRKDVQYPTRENIRVERASFYSDIPVSELLEYVSAHDLEQVFIGADGYEDNTRIEVYTYRKQTDIEYFDMLSSYICPTQYQIDEFQQYQRLKLKYGEST